MKSRTTSLIGIGTLCSLLSAAIPSSRGGDTLPELFQKGLLEEEANHDLAAAIQAYQKAIGQMAEFRKIEAAALFHLGECYRKLGQTNQANAQFERILREYPNETQIVKASRLNLGSSAPAASPEMTLALTQDLLRAEAALSQHKTLLESLGKKSRRELRQVLPTAFRDEQLERFLMDLGKAEQEIAVRSVDFDAKHPEVVKLTVLIKNINEQIENRIDGVLQGLETLVVSHEAQVAQIKAQLARAPRPEKKADLVDSALPSEDIEGKEIERLKKILHDSPDLIHGGVASDAIENGSERVLRFLLDQGVDANSVERGSLLLCRAVTAGRIRLVELLIERGARVNEREPGGRTSLHSAVEGGNKTITEFLLARGADVDAKTRKGETPLLIAARSGFRAVAQVLLEHNANPIAADSMGTTPLHEAVARRPILEMMLNRGANINAEDSTGTPILFKAVAVGTPEDTEFLIRKGAKINATNREGLTALHWALTMLGHPAQPPLCKEPLEQAKALLRAGADPNIADVRGFTAISSVMFKQNLELLRDFLEHGLDASRPIGRVTDDYGSLTPLHLVTRGQTPGFSERGLSQLPGFPLEAAKLLAEHKADVNARDKTGRTPLFYAVEAGNSELITFLLDQKADPNIADNSGIIPIMFTQAPELQRLLVSRGSKQPAAPARSAASPYQLDPALASRYGLIPSSAPNPAASQLTQEMARRYGFPQVAVPTNPTPARLPNTGAGPKQ